jgi:hypothetical protein
MATEPVDVVAEDASASESEDHLSLEMGTSEGVLSDASTSASSSVSSLLDRLRPPTPAVLARKRRLERNPPPKGTKRGKGKEKGDPKTISLSERIKAYPNEEFTVSNSKLFCRACREELATKKSSLESHIRSQKHVNGKKKLALKNKEQADIIQALKAYDSEVHPVGDRLPFSTRVYWVKVVSTMLRAGVPLGKIDLLTLGVHAQRGLL